MSLCFTAGCGKGGSDDNVLRVSNWLHAAVDPSFLRLERDLESEFEQVHAGIDLRIEPIPGPGQYAPKLILMHIAGNPSDAGYLDLASGAQFMNKGVVADLMPFVRNDAEFRLADYFPNVLASFRRDEQLFGIPLDFTPMVMYYNKTLFDAAGVPYPRDGWSWDEFLATARRLSAADADATRPLKQYGMYFENIMPFWILWVWSNGGDVLSPDGRRCSGYLDGSPAIEAYDFLLSLMYDERVAPSLQERAALGQDLFLAGKAAMDLKGHWMLIDYRAAGLDVGVVTVPTNIGRPVSVLYESGLCVFARGRNPGLGWEWIKFMTSEAVQVRRVASGLAISGNRKAAAHYAGNAVEDAFLRHVDYGRLPWGTRVERYPFVEELGTEMMRTMVNLAGELKRAAMDETAYRSARRAMLQRVAGETAAALDAALDE